MYTGLTRYTTFISLKIIEYRVLKGNGKNWNKDDIIYKELLSFHPACTAVTVLRSLIKSVFEICYCVIEENVYKMLLKN
jgi:hypothetical protein